MRPEVLGLDVFPGDGAVGDINGDGAAALPSAAAVLIQADDLLQEMGDEASAGVGVFRRGLEGDEGLAQMVGTPGIQGQRGVGEQLTQAGFVEEQALVTKGGPPCV